MFKLIKQEGNARRGELTTVHGTIQTPVFMNVGTSAAIKGGISSVDLADQLKCQVERRRYNLQNGRSAQIHELAQAYSYRQRRISGFFAC